MFGTFHVYGLPYHYRIITNARQPLCKSTNKKLYKVEDGRETTLKYRFLAVRTYRAVSSFY